MTISRKIISVMLALITALSVAAVGFTEVSVSAAKIDEGNELIGDNNNFNMHLGQYEYFYVIPIYPDVIYESFTNSKPSVAEITSDGKGGLNIHAKSLGKTNVKITVKSSNGSAVVEQYAECVINVLPVPSAPANLTIRNYETGFNINWSKAAYAERYRVFYKTREQSNWNYVDTGYNYYNLLELTPGKLYYIQVRSLGAENFYGGITGVKSYTHVPATHIFNFSYNTNGTVSIGWQKEDADGYAVARKKAGDKNYKYFYTKDTSFTDKSIATGAVYYYQVSPYRTIGKTAVYGEWTYTRSVATLFTPTVTSIYPSKSIMNINWNKIKGAESYKIAFRRETDSAWNYRTVKTTYYNIPNPTPEVTYFVQVAAVCGNVQSRYSSPKSAKYLKSDLKKTKITAAFTGEGFDVKWDALEGAVSYQIKKYTLGTGGDTVYITVNGTEYFDDDYVDGKTVEYIIRGFDGTNYGPWSDYTLSGALAVPEITGVKYNSNGITLTWREVTGAQSYKIAYKKESDSGWSYVRPAWHSYHVINDVEPNTTYYIQICPIGNYYVSGRWSKVYSITTSE